MAEEFTITDENKHEVLAAAFENVSEITGDDVEDWDDFRRHPLVREVWRKKGNGNAVVKTFSFNPPTTEPREETTARGFYLGHDPNRQYDEDEEEWYIEDEGPRVLFADGAVQSRGNLYPIWGVRNGQDFREELDPLGPGRVVVEGIQARRNVYTGQTTYHVNADACKVKEVDHDAEIPEMGLEEHITHCFNIGGDRNTIYSDTDDAFAILTIGDEDAISFFEPNKYNDEPTLRVVAEDSEGIKTRFKLPVKQTMEDFGVEEDSAEPEVFQQLLKNQPIAVYGRLGVSYDLAITTNDDADSPTPDGQATVEACLNDIEQYDDAGWMTKYDETDDGVALEAIDYTDHNDVDENGNPVATPIDIGPYKAYDVRQEYDGNLDEIVWKVEILNTDEDGYIWMDVRRHTWSRVDYDDGSLERFGRHLTQEEIDELPDDAEVSVGTANESAFVVFLNQSGDQVFLPESDPFAGKFDDLPGFEEIEDDAEESEDAAEPNEAPAETPL